MVVCDSLCLKVITLGFSKTTQFWGRIHCGNLSIRRSCVAFALFVTLSFPNAHFAVYCAKGHPTFICMWPMFLLFFCKDHGFLQACTLQQTNILMDFDLFPTRNPSTLHNGGLSMTSAGKTWQKWQSLPILIGVSFCWGTAQKITLGFVFFEATLIEIARRTT